MSSQRYQQKVRTETFPINHLLRASSIWLTHNHPAADAFILRYYRALERQRDSIASLYVPYQQLPENAVVPNIKINGNSVLDGPEMQVHFKTGMPRLKYNVESFDCHVINKNYPLVTGNGNQPVPGNGKNLQLSITVSGTLEIGEPKSIEHRGFSDNFVIVPTALQKGKSKSSSYDYVIMMQNFRFVV